MRAVIFDIDGTLANTSHRLHYVTGGARDWPAFFGAMADDTLVEPIREVLRALLRSHNAVLLCSGRPEDYRAATEAWLAVEEEKPWHF